VVSPALHNTHSRINRAVLQAHVHILASVALLSLVEPLEGSDISG
jgi:hypothetical protein